jgi:phage terminase small subunit
MWDNLTRRKAKQDELSAREVRFCQYYVEDNNAVKAMTRAGYKWKNNNVTGVKAFQLLRKGKIRSYIHNLRTQAKNAAEVHYNRIVQEWSYIAFGDRKAAFREDGTLKDPKEWDAQIESMISEVDTIISPDGTTIKKVKFERRPEALKELMRILEKAKEFEGSTDGKQGNDNEVLLSNPDAISLAGE